MNTAIIPRLWSSLPGTTDYLLPLSTSVLVELLALKVPIAPAVWRLANKWSFPLFHPRNHPAPSAKPEIRRHVKGEELPCISPASEYALAPCISGWEAAWLAAAPSALGEFIWLVFYQNSIPVGVSLCRLHIDHSIPKANLIHIQTRRRSSSEYTWIVAETVRFLYREGAHLVRCRASCPVLGSALKANRFIARYQVPSSWWAKDRNAPHGPMHITSFRADEALMPLPSALNSSTLIQ